MKNINHIGVLTSGGDAPGMNAAIRAVVRTAVYHNIKVSGIYRGYQGLIENDIKELQTQDVANIIQRGGTILKTARCKSFHTKEGMLQAYNNCIAHHLDAFVIIGGDGSFRGANEFTSLFNLPTIGMPGTIDNDLIGTDFTIGYDTAINIVVEAVDRIRDTAASHNRLFFVEVMGRDAGLIALRSGISVGAEAILIPETITDIPAIVNKLTDHKKRNKLSSIIIVAEGDEAGGAFDIAEKVKPFLQDTDIRVSVLGHIQRGGSPTAMDRVLASRMGFAAVNELLKGNYNCMVGIVNQHVKLTPYAEATKHIQKLNKDLLKMIDVLST